MSVAGAFPWEAKFYDPAFLASGAGDRSDDALIESYVRRAVERAGTVLDVGCGTGRVTLELARRGASVVAIDAHAGMIKAVESRLEQEPELGSRVRTVHADFANVVGYFATTVIAADDFLTHFLDANELRTALRAMAGLLDDRGVIYTDLRGRDRGRLGSALRPPFPVRAFGVRMCNGLQQGAVAVSVVGWDEYVECRRLLTSHQQFSLLNPDGKVIRIEHKTIRQRLHTFQEIRDAAASVGLVAHREEIASSDHDATAWISPEFLSMERRK